MAAAREGENPNNISPIFTYSLEGGVTVMWMGDLETEFIEAIKDDLNWPKANILFAPHHGRYSGKVPEEVLAIINPDIVVIGEAPSEYLNYYEGYNTITQNSAGDITFDCLDRKAHIHVSESDYSVDFLVDESVGSQNYYLGTINL